MPPLPNFLKFGTTLKKNQKPFTLTTIKSFHCRVEFHQNKWIICWTQEWFDKLNDESHSQQFFLKQALEMNILPNKLDKTPDCQSKFQFDCDISDL